MTATAQSNAAAILAALGTAWRGDGNLAAFATAGQTIRIFDGPNTGDRAATIELWIGATGDPDDEETVIEASQVQSVLDRTLSRDEAVQVTNAVSVYQGNVDVADARVLAFGVLDAAVAAVRDSDLGLSTVYDATALTAWQLRQGQYEDGAGVLLTFTLTFQGVI